MRFTGCSTSCLALWIPCTAAFVVQTPMPSSLAGQEIRRMQISHNRRPTLCLSQQRFISKMEFGLSVAKATELSVEEIDEDDFDFENVPSYDDFRNKLLDCAKRTSFDTTVVAEAQAVFDDMYKAFIMTEDSSLYPSTEIYNIFFEVLAFAKDYPDGATEIEGIVAKMADPSESAAKPDLKTYETLMDAWMRRKQLDKVESVFEELRSHEDPDLQADVGVYNKMIKSYGMLGLAQQAEALFEEMLASAEEGDDYDSLKPNNKSWVQVMRAYAGPKYLNDGVDKIQSMIGRMAVGFRNGAEDWRPTAETLTALLQALGRKRGNSKEAEGILYSMIEQYKDGDEDLMPTDDSFYHVMNAYKSEAEPGSALKIEKLIQLQEALDDGHNEKLKLSQRTIVAAMTAISRSRDPKKAVVAKRLYSRIEKRHEQGDTGFEPNLFVFKSILNSCAYTRGNPEERMNAFQVAVDSLNAIRTSPNFSPDSKVYELFIKSCGSLMPDNAKRDAIVDSVFRKCCKDGLMDEKVLEEFRLTASDELQLRLLGGFLDDGVLPPKEWSASVVQRKS